MFDDFLGWFFTMFSSFFIGVINIVTLPIMKLLQSIVPNFDSILFYANELLTQFFFVGAQFAKMVFVNFIGINHSVFTFTVCCFLLRIIIFFGLRFIRFALNIWAIFRGARSGGE